MGTQIPAQTHRTKSEATMLGHIRIPWADSGHACYPPPFGCASPLPPPFRSGVYSPPEPPSAKTQCGCGLSRLVPGIRSTTCRPFSDRIRGETGQINAGLDQSSRPKLGALRRKLGGCLDQLWETPANDEAFSANFGQRVRPTLECVDQIWNDHDQLWWTSTKLGASLTQIVHVRPNVASTIGEVSGDFVQICNFAAAGATHGQASTLLGAAKHEHPASTM